MLRKNGAVTKLTSIFDSGLKFDSSINPIVFEDIVSFISLKLAGLSLGESVALAYCLCFSQNKVLNLSAKKALKTRMPEMRNQLQLAEVPEDIRMGILALVQNDEVGNFFNALRQIIFFMKNVYCYEYR